MARTMNYKKPKDTKKTLKRLLGYLGVHKIAVAIVAILVTVSSVASILGTYLLKPVVNRYILPGDVEGLARMLFFMGVMYAVGVLATYGYGQIMARTGQQVVSEIREDLFRHTQGLPLSYFDGHTHGELMSRFTNDVDTISEALNNSFTTLIQSFFTIAGTIICIILLNFKLSLIVLVFMLLMFFFIKYSGARGKRYFNSQQKYLGEVNGFIEEMVDGQKVEKVFNHEEVDFKEFSKRNVSFGEAQMKTLGIMTHDGVYTNLGLLLSDQCVHTIKVAAFEGTTQNQFKDRKEFSGSLFQQMDEVYDYIDFRNQTHSTFQKLYRIDQRDYPETAVREALLNLLVHREYSFRASTFISLYEDRLEFTSIGGLVSGVTLNDVLMGISVCRNMKLANVFYRLELIEAYGTGILKMKEAYSETGKEPKIEISDNAFKVILPNLNVHTNQEKQGANKTEEYLAEEAVINLAKRQGTFTRKDVEKELEISQTTCGRLLRRMIDKMQIMQEGKGKNTHYRILE